MRSEHVFYSAGPGELSNAAQAGAGQGPSRGLAFRPAPAAYVCGPGGFMTDMQDALAALGADPARIHTELFGAQDRINPGITGQNRPATPPATGSPGNRPAGDLRPQRDFGPVRHHAAQRARTRRGLRRPHPLELPHWCLPHLHHTPAVRRHHLLARPAGSPPPTGRCSSAALSPAPRSSWTCERRERHDNNATPAASDGQRKADGICRGLRARARSGRHQPGRRPAAGHLRPAAGRGRQHRGAVAGHRPVRAPCGRLGHAPPEVPPEIGFRPHGQHPRVVSAGHQGSM